MAVASVWTIRLLTALMPLHLASTWDIVVRVAILTTAVVIIVIVILIVTEIVILIAEEIVTRTGILMVVIVETGVTAAAQYHHEVEAVIRPIIGVVEVTQEVLPEAAVLCVEEVEITTPLPRRILLLRVQPIRRLVGKGIILEIV
jgi:hypothetical protein